jgi:glyceraldehyde 3-phosphate dehydrogenase
VAKLPEKDLRWSDYGVDIVIESTGVRRTHALMEPHIAAGAKKVILTAPPKDETIPVFVIGANADKYAGETIVSNASCTTNCLAPVAKVLHEKFGIRAAHLTTVHAVTGDQNILDNSHKDLRRSRSFMPSIIPCKTGVSSALRTVLPEIAENFTGQALRVPTPVVSMIDLVAELERETTVDEVHAALRAASEASGLIGLCDEPLVSVDFIGDDRSAIVDMESTKILNGRLLKILLWYDNEWGYSSRVVDLVRLIAK